MKTITHILVLVSLFACLFLSCHKDDNPLSAGNFIVHKILFTAANNLCLIDSDGKNLQILASGPSGSFVDWQAQLSPDGSQVAYAHVDTTYQQIFLLDLATRKTVNLSNDNFFHESPSFSPDGKNVLFLTAHGWMQSIYLKNLQSGELTQLTKGLNCYSPSYSIDGSQIVFAVNNGIDSQGVALMASNSTNVKLLGPGWNPQLSTDGRRILYTGFYTAYEEGLYVMNVDGSQKQFLSTIPFQTIPQLSPNATKIVLSNFVNNNFDIFIMNSDGSSVLNLTNTPFAEFQPSFSPDGRKITYVSSDTSASDKLVIMSIDGSEKTLLVGNLGRLRDASFSRY